MVTELRSVANNFRVLSTGLASFHLSGAFEVNSGEF
jgi:hypothetical protein